MKKIIFFDIDGPIFNSNSFLNDFWNEFLYKFNLSSPLEVKTIYEAVKEETGYFSPEIFLKKILEFFPQINLKDLTSLFWDNKLIIKNIYPDTKTIEELSKGVKIGIFSTGDEVFQRKKLIFIENFLSKEDVYIFPNKLDNFDKIFEKYTEDKIYFVDDKSYVLTKAKEVSPNIFTILIDRENKFFQNYDFDAKIENLYDLIDVIEFKIGS